MAYKVYLAGPMYKLSYDEATAWREEVWQKLGGKVKCLSPLRGKAFLKEERELRGSYEKYPLSTDKGINFRDHWDVQRCDLVLANLAGATRVSIGTAMEVAWAHAYGKPVVLVMEEGSVHDHPMIRECSPFIVHSLDEAIKIIKTILDVNI